MGVIKNNAIDEFILLNVHHEVGRNPNTATTYLPGRDVSKSHATFGWKDGHWFLRDHSRNGTLINGKFAHHHTISIQKGDSLQFGKDDGSKWELVDDAAPTSYLKAITNNVKVLALAPATGIPFPSAPEVSFYFTSHNRWRAETKGSIIDLMQGTQLHFSQEDWIFIENSVLDDTLDYGLIVSTAYFKFILSEDEERLSVQIVGNGWQLNLGERVHNYLLLVLVRKRLRDSREGASSHDIGWLEMEALTKDMGREFRKEVDAYQVNLQIYRLRQQLLQMEPYGYLFSNVVERRKGELRFNHRYFKVVKWGEIQEEITAD